VPVTLDALYATLYFPSYIKTFFTCEVQEKRKKKEQKEGNFKTCNIFVLKEIVINETGFLDAKTKIKRCL